MKLYKLYGKIIGEYGSIGRFADYHSISRQTVSNKLNLRTELTRSDMESWCESLGIKSEEFFDYFFPEIGKKKA